MANNTVTVVVRVRDAAHVVEKMHEMVRGLIDDGIISAGDASDVLALRLGTFVKSIIAFDTDGPEGAVAARPWVGAGTEPSESLRSKVVAAPHALGGVLEAAAEVARAFPDDDESCGVGRLRRALAGMRVSSRSDAAVIRTLQERLANALDTLAEFAEGDHEDECAAVCVRCRRIAKRTALCPDTDMVYGCTGGECDCRRARAGAVVASCQDAW
jgi:hypothetical protein